MRRSQRQKNVKKVKKTQEMVLSDHKPISIILNEITKPKGRIEEKRQPNTNFDKLKDRQTLERFQCTTEELRAQLANEPSWNKLVKTLSQAAKKTSGMKKRNAANRWTVGHKNELKILHDAINGLVMHRSEVLARRSVINFTRYGPLPE